MDGRMAGGKFRGKLLGEKLANLGSLVRDAGSWRFRGAHPGDSRVNSPGHFPGRRASPLAPHLHAGTSSSASTASSDRNLDRDANAADGKLVTHGYAGAKA